MKHFVQSRFSLILRGGASISFLLGAIALSYVALGRPAEESRLEKDPSTAPKPKPAAPVVSVNRTLPKVSAPRAGLAFSEKPSTEEIFRARIFAEPLLPLGTKPDDSENAALAGALRTYSQRSSLDDFSSLTTFLKSKTKSPWRASILLNLGFEYYNTAYYSLALDAWAEAWRLSKTGTEAAAKSIGDRAAGELAGMYARLGRMTELEALLSEVKSRVFVGPATESISAAEAGLANMKERPEDAFKCGPMALHRIKASIDPKDAGDVIIRGAASTQDGLSLPQVADISKQIGLNYEMAFREPGAPFVVPSVVHWKLGHYAALIRQDGDRFLVRDPTFRNDVWATSKALEEESSGYFLVPSEKKGNGWRSVANDEGGQVWGKGNVGDNDKDKGRPKDKKKPDPCQKPKGKGMAVPDVHLMLVSLNIVDEPVGYEPPVGPRVGFLITYNQREANQPTAFTYSSFGPKWTFDWVSYITDNPFNTAANVKHFVMGGGTSTFTGFDASTQKFAPEHSGQEQLTRTSSSSYELVSPEGSKQIFALSDGSTGTTRKVFLTQVVDAHGNAVSLTYDSNFRVVAITDAIGQVSTLSYTNPSDIYKITKITDPFGRFATFDYDLNGRLIKITDVIGITSEFTYEGASDFINALITPYGTTSFLRSQSGTTRVLETTYPTGEKDRVEFNQSATLGIPFSVPASQLPAGMNTHNEYIWFRNTYYWSRNAYATAYPDYTKARLYHWLHTTDVNVASTTLESEKGPLEGRVWYDYVGQSDPIFDGTIGKPSHIGRVLDDGTTQLYTFEYNSFGKLTKSIDPAGRTMSYVYAPNGIDLLEERQTRAGNELLARATYNGQHLPLTVTDAAGQTTTYTYNVRGQLLTETNAKNETTTYTYDASGYVTRIDGPLPGLADSHTFTYDSFGRRQTATDESGYVLTYDYDALDRLAKTTYPDGTFEQVTYTNLDVTEVRDRAGEKTFYEFTPLRQMSKQTDPLNRVTRFEWCGCGGLESVTDPMGRTTSWETDIQDRITAKVYPDGSRVSYFYESLASRVRQRMDEKGGVTRYHYHNDDTLRAIEYANTVVPTAAVSYTYDPNYRRIATMADQLGTTRFTYHPISASPSLGATLLATVDGPLPNDTIAYGYDQLGRQTSRSINGVAATLVYDALERNTSETNALGTFTYAYEGNSARLTGQTYPNSQTSEWAYVTNAQDQLLQRITHKVGGTKLSESLYSHDPSRAGRINSWSQQIAVQPASVSTFAYDDADQLLSASVTNSPVSNYSYSYDSIGNRLTEGIGAATSTATYNALSELTSVTGAAGTASTYEWDAEQRLAAVNSGNERTEFIYDGSGKRVGIRKLVGGSEVSNRKFIWSDDELCEERDAAGAVVKRFFAQGVKIESGATAGVYFYTRDHLGSIRELTDSTGAVRARYAYDPFGRQVKLSGDREADFGFAGMFWSAEASLNLTRFRSYSPALGRWLSRDPVQEAEIVQGPNLYAYVGNDPVNNADPLGLKDKKPPPPKPAPPVKPPDCAPGEDNNPNCIPKWDACWRDPNNPWCKGPRPPPPPPTPGPSCMKDPGNPWCEGPKPCVWDYFNNKCFPKQPPKMPAPKKPTPPPKGPKKPPAPKPNPCPPEPK